MATPAPIFHLIRIARRFAHNGMRLFAARALLQLSEENLNLVEIAIFTGKLVRGAQFSNSSAAPHEMTLRVYLTGPR